MSEWLYGRQAVREALRAGRPIQRLLLAVPASSAPDKPARPTPVHAELADLARARHIPVEHLPAQRLDSLAHGAHHQGVVAEAAPYRYTAWGDLLDRGRAAGSEALLLFLDSLQDPQNFGTLLRAAEAAGVTGVILPQHRAVGVTPAVVNASAGAVEHLAVAQVPNLARAIQDAQTAGVWVWALDTEPPVAAYTAADLTGPLGLVVGAEGAGVGRLVRARCDGALVLPMHGQVASLNAATAGAIVLYEALRQRASRAKTPPESA